MTSHRLKLGLVALAATAGLISGAGSADAVASGTATGLAPGAQLDVGVPSDGVHPEALVVAPDGTRISATSAQGFGSWRSNRSAGATADSKTQATSMADTPDYYGDTLVSDARIRASVPNGTVLGLVRIHENGIAGCKIPGNDGYLWGWVGFTSRWTNQFTYGWMRGDLFRAWNSRWSFWTTVNGLPWCG